MNEITFLVFVNCAQNNGVFFYAIDNLFVSSTYCVSCKVWFAFMRHLESEKTQKTRKKHAKNAHFCPFFRVFLLRECKKAKSARRSDREKRKRRRENRFFSAPFMTLSIKNCDHASISAMIPPKRILPSS